MSAKPQQGFDRDSGQVYTETTCKPGPMTADWMWKTRGRPERVAKHVRVGRGCASLRNMSIRCAMFNIRSITPESLNGVPWPVAQPLWRSIVRRNLDSFQVWKTFVLNYSNEDFGEYSADYGFKRKTIRDLEMGLDDCIASLMHPSPSWITFLTLTDTACTKTGLIRLSRLSNLGVLTILPCKGTQRVETAVILVDDSLFRAWGRAASEIGAFSKFRIFLCYSQSILTKQAFSYLQDLPSLGLMEFGKCHADVAAGKCSGWIGKQDDEVSEYLGMWHGGSWQVAYESCFDQDGIFDPEKFKSAHRFKFRGPPILDFNLGYEAQDPCRPDLHEPSDKGKLLFHRDRPPGPASSNNDITGRGRPSPSLSDPQGTSTKKPSIRKSKLELSDTVWSEICS